MKKGAAHWERTTLSQIADLVGGGTPPRADESNFGDYIDWVTPGDLPPIGIVSELGKVSEGLSKRGLDGSSAQRLPENTVLFSSRASIGKIAVANRPCATNQGFANFVPRNGAIDPWFLAFLLRRFTSEIVQLAGETTYKEVSRGKLRDFPVSVPPLKEQRRIVARLKEMMVRVDETVALRMESAKESSSLLGALVEDIIADLPGTTARLSEVCSIEGVLVDPRLSEYRALKHVGGANIESATGRFVDLQTAEQEGLISGKFLFGSKDVLYSKIRPYLRKVARPGFKGLCSADMYPLRPKHGVLDRDYLFFLLLSRGFTNYAIGVSNRAGMPKVNREQLCAFEFKLPNIEAQAEAASRLDAAMKSILAINAEFQRTERETGAIRDAILRKAFAGEL